MALNTVTYLALKQLFNQSINDDIEVDTTTLITTTKLVVSTTLNSYDDAENGYFDNWWVEITEGENIGAKRKLGSTTYATATGTAYVYGANLAAESAHVTVRFHRYDPTRKENAILRACEEIYPTLKVPIDDITLITGNMLYDGHLEYWSLATALRHWAASSITLAQTSTAGLVRGGKYSAKCSATADDGYITFKSDSYPKLLQLQGKTVSAYVMAYPQVANDAAIVIYTMQAAGVTTAQTLTSDTACPAGEFTMLELEDQKLNDDLVEVELRLKVGTDTKYVYFDDAWFGESYLLDYRIPDDFIGGNITEIRMQTEATSDPAFYDINPFIREMGQPLEFDTVSDGTNDFIRLHEYAPIKRRLRLIGHKPLETLSAGTDKITIADDKVDLLVAKARMIFWEREAVPLNPEDKSRFEYEYNKAARDYNRLLITKGMGRPAQKIKSRYY